MSMFNRWDSQQGRRFWESGTRQATYDATYTSMKGLGASSKDADFWATNKTADGGEDIIWFFMTCWFSPISCMYLALGAFVIAFVIGWGYSYVVLIGMPLETFCRSIHLTYWIYLPLLLIELGIILSGGLITLSWIYQFIEKFKIIDDICEVVFRAAGWGIFLSFWGYVLYNFVPWFISLI